MHIIRIVGFLGLLLAIPSSCGGNNTDKAAGCVETSYPLGCLGDGRPASATTPGDYPSTSCARTAYTYFKLDVMIGDPNTRSQISTCRLQISDSSGMVIEAYSLPSVETTGGNYGCSPGLTHANVGQLSYTSCCSASETLQFTLLAKDSNETVVQAGTVSSPCTKYGQVQEVPLRITTQTCGAGFYPAGCS